MSNFLSRLKEQAAANKPAEIQNAPPQSGAKQPATEAKAETSGQTGLRFAFGRKPTAATVPAVQTTADPSTGINTAVGQDVSVRAEPVTDGPAGFQASLDRLDALCQSSAGIDPLAHAAVKAHVRGIMIELIANPEMRGLVIDRDMHNIMKFIQSSADTADTKFTKAAVTRAKKTAKAGLASNFDDAFDQLMLPAPTLDAMSALNSDSIPTKVK